MKARLTALIQLLPVLLSVLLIAAHFSRADNFFLVGLCLATPLLLLFRRPLTARLIQAGLLLAAVEWVRTAVVLALGRSDQGLPWMRMTLILAAVALFTLGSLFVFLSKTLRTRYNLTSSG